MTPHPAQPDLLHPATLDAMIRAALRSLPLNLEASTVELAMQRQAAIIAVTSLRPRDPIEAALAARFVALHFAVMESFHRAMLPDVTEAVAIRLRGNAITLSRLMNQTLQDLERRQAGPAAYPHPAQGLPSEPAATADAVAEPARPAQAVREAVPTAAPAPTASPNPQPQRAPAGAPRGTVPAAVQSRPAIVANPKPETTEELAARMLDAIAARSMTAMPRPVPPATLRAG